MTKSSSATNASEASLPPKGLPSQQQHITTIFRFKPSSDPRNNFSPEGIPGEYVVTFTLSRPGFNPLPERQYSFARGVRGNSHLAITRPAFTPPGNADAVAIKIVGRTEDGQFAFQGFPNEAGFLAKIESAPFSANSFSDAEEKAYRAIAPSLSNWAAHLDIPLNVYQVDSLHVPTGNSRMSMNTAVWEVPFSVVPIVELKPEFRGYVSLYREALGTSSPVYAFLCFFKIIEGIRLRQRDLALEAKRTGQIFRRPQRRVPKSEEEGIPWLNAIFPVRQAWDPMALSSIFIPEVLDKKFGDVIDKILEPLRNDIAHALSSKSGELRLSVDELLHTQKVNKWLPLTKCIARRMLKDEFPNDFLSYLREDGTVAG
jgi:methylamine utilization protein MauJ